MCGRGLIREKRLKKRAARYFGYRAAFGLFDYFLLLPRLWRGALGMLFWGASFDRFRVLAALCAAHDTVAGVARCALYYIYTTAWLLSCGGCHPLHPCKRVQGEALPDGRGVAAHPLRGFLERNPLRTPRTFMRFAALLQRP